MIEMGIYSDNEKWDEIKTIKMTTTKNNEIKNDNTSKKNYDTMRATSAHKVNIYHQSFFLINK